MRRGAELTMGLKGTAWTLLLLTTAACTTTPPQPPPVVEPEPEPVVAEPPEPIIVLPPEPIPEPEPAPVEPLPSVAIVLAGRVPAYESVVVELEQEFKTFSIFDLNDKSLPPDMAFRQIHDSDTAAVIAVGLNAARMAVAMSRVPVIFAQVFNYQDHGLVTESSRGVAAIAPLDRQLAAWRGADPTLSSVGIIIGEGHDDLIAKAELAAAEQGLDLSVQVARSDQETLYLYKRMIPDIDGFWLFPDNRILSARVLQEILNEARRRNITVVAPNDALLQMGAAISITTEPSDVAARIAAIVQQITAGRFADVPALTPLTGLRITTNADVLRKPLAFRETDSARESLE